MVTLWNAVRHDLVSLRERLSPSPPPAPGLYTFRVAHPGGQMRIHLRIEQDHSGVLFVDVTEVIHLNPTAAEFVKWALEGMPHAEATARLRGRYGRQPKGWQQDLRSIYEMIQRFFEPTRGCPTCALEMVDRRALFSTPIQAPYKADLALTYECNNDCPHCYNEADRIALGMLGLREWSMIIDRVTEIGIPHLIFTGGEATLHPDLLEIIHYADERGPVCGMNTNGRRLAHLSFAQQLVAAGLNHVQITLGSHRPEIHDRMMHAHAYQQTIRGIENALSSGLHTITNTTLMRMNADEIEETIDFIYALGIRTFAVNGMIYSGGGFETGQAIPENEMAPALMRIRDKALELGMRFLWYTPTQYCRLSPVELDVGAKRCNAGEYSLCIEPNGDVLPCQSYYVTAGNMLRDPWEKIWRGELFRSFRDRQQDPRASGLPEMCWECPDLPLCGGGCRIEREAAQGVRVAKAHAHSGGGCCGAGCGVGEKPKNTGFVSVDSLVTLNKRRGTGEFL